MEEVAPLTVKEAEPTAAAITDEYTARERSDRCPYDSD